mmetsp:Transcript_20222/g.19886  ORF Transcript_20222/g.19886 Transcript_20222/m.19886 type:complete len:214 (+) Transcript_20222:475-1116(+)
MLLDALHLRGGSRLDANVAGGAMAILASAKGLLGGALAVAIAEGAGNAFKIRVALKTVGIGSADPSGAGKVAPAMVVAGAALITVEAANANLVFEIAGQARAAGNHVALLAHVPVGGALLVLLVTVEGVDALAAQHGVAGLVLPDGLGAHTIVAAEGSQLAIRKGVRAFLALPEAGRVLEARISRGEGGDGDEQRQGAQQKRDLVHPGGALRF